MAIRSVFYRFCLKKAQVPNVPNGRFFFMKKERSVAFRSRRVSKTAGYRTYRTVWGIQRG